MDTMQYIYIVSAYFVYLRANTGLGKRENERQVAGQFFFYRGSFGAESDGRTQRTQSYRLETHNCWTGQRHGMEGHTRHKNCLTSLPGF